MVLWLKKRWVDILFLLCITSIVLLPYLTKDFVNIEHDTFFHISRIEQLSKSIQHGIFFPSIYPYENNNFGYASPLFYNDTLLLIPALFHLCGLALSTSYKLTIFLATFLSAYTMFTLTKHITKTRMIAWIASSAFLFSNYRITDIYVRGALGEIFAFAFIPVMLLGIYEILYEQKNNCITFTIGITCLALSHNLTFLMCCVLCVILCIVSYKKLTKKAIYNLLLGTLFAFLLSAFFTIPMLEQLSSQEFVVDYYGQTSDLASGSMDFWQYFVNQTIFGYSGNNLEHSMTMTVNIGWLLTFVPLLYIFQKNKNPFVLYMFIIGYICFILPSSLIPWDKLPLQILQFPWRTNTLTMTLLCIPASIGIYSICKQKWLTSIVLVFLISECIYLVLPVYTRTFGLTSKQTWSDVLDGALCDPYYSAYYVRVELAGGDYLPLHSVDFRNRSTSIKDAQDHDLPISYTTDYMTISFDTNTLQTSTQLVLPKTWYKGYVVYEVHEQGNIKVDCFSTSNGLVTFIAKPNQSYIVTYEDTPIRKISLCISACSGIAFVLYLIRSKKKCHI